MFLAGCVDLACAASIRFTRPGGRGENLGRFIALVLAIVAAAIAGTATFSEDYFTALGKAVVTFLAAVAGGALPAAASSGPARNWGRLVLILAVAGSFLSARFFKDDAPPGVASFVAGCKPFNLHAQNRWDPIGAARWVAPMPTAKKEPAFGGNELVAIDGWVRTRAAYPTNSPPWNSSVWFHLADDSGWVSFAGVRAEPTPPGIRPVSPSRTAGPDPPRRSVQVPLACRVSVAALSGDLQILG